MDLTVWLCTVSVVLLAVASILHSRTMCRMSERIDLLQRMLVEHIAQSNRSERVG